MSGAIIECSIVATRNKMPKKGKKGADQRVKGNMKVFYNI